MRRGLTVVPISQMQRSCLMWTVPSRQAVVAMIQLVFSYLKDIPDLDTRNELAETLNNVTANEVHISLLFLPYDPVKY